MKGGNCPPSFWRAQYMTTIYENKILEVGPLVEELKGENMIVLFGTNAPAELREFCLLLEVKPVNGEIVPGHTLYIDDNKYEITAVGNAVKQNLQNLAHITIKFDGSKEAELPGTLYVEAKPVPEIAVGSVLKITE